MNAVTYSRGVKYTHRPTVRGIIESFDYNADQAHRKTINPSTHKVYKVFARAALQKVKE